jgi:cytidine deaminase
MSPDALIAAARQARQNAYCPYSGFAVGAALLAASGKVYVGANCECASFGGTICAERAALTAAVTAGERVFTALAVAGGDRPLTPCGICRQTLSEFAAGRDFPVYCAPGEGEGRLTTTLGSLLPDRFGAEDLSPDRG